MCVGPVKDMMQPKVIQNTPVAPPPAPEPPPLPIANPTMSEAKSTEQDAPDLAIPRKKKSGNSLRIDRTGGGTGGGSGLNVPY